MHDDVTEYDLAAFNARHNKLKATSVRFAELFALRIEPANSSPTRSVVNMTRRARTASRPSIAPARGARRALLRLESSSLHLLPPRQLDEATCPSSLLMSTPMESW